MTSVQTTKSHSTSNRMHDYREHLKVITNSLVEMAKSAGRSNYSLNQLLRECYNLADAELDTYEGWLNRGAQVRKGQHAYLFWGKPVTTEAGYCYSPVNFLFTRDQVRMSRSQEEYLYK